MNTTIALLPSDSAHVIVRRSQKRIVERGAAARANALDGLSCRGAVTGEILHQVHSGTECRNCDAIIGLDLAAAIAAAWLGWALGKRLGLSRASAAAVAVGSVMGGVNLAVLAWVLLTRAPPDRPPA